MQKLVALYLSNYTADRMLHEDGDRREYLEDQLKLGWCVVSVTPLGSVAPDNGPTSTWVMVLLEKTPPPASAPQPAAPPKPT